jgi:light-regulated signal transduction histidine kinase (bacteriophytochrome)
MKEQLPCHIEMKNKQVKPGNFQQTVDLTNKIETLTKEMNQFTYIVSHDLQAPLRMVTGFLELLEKKHGDNLDESGKQFIGYAVKGANKMKSLIFDLLEYSRLSSVINEYSEVDLNIIFQETIEKMRPIIEETNAILTSDNLPVVNADRKHMAQLFEHLLGNALKYRSTSIPEINIKVNEKSKYWELAVSDNGIGIDTSFREKIFIIFRRLHNDDSIYTGTGIGLAISKKIVELHDGTIWMDSESGKGSTFFFTLPKKCI